MTQKQFDKATKRIKRLEDKARAIQDQLYATRKQWEKVIDTLRDGSLEDYDKWIDYCEDKGIATTYCFGDILC